MATAVTATSSAPIHLRFTVEFYDRPCSPSSLSTSSYPDGNGTPITEAPASSKAFTDSGDRRCDQYESRHALTASASGEWPLPSSALTGAPRAMSSFTTLCHALHPATCNAV